MVRLGDVCEILDNMRIPIKACDRKAGQYPYYGANGLQDYIDNYIFDDELVLLAEDGGNFGSKDKPIAYRVSGKCWVNNHAHVLKPKQNLDVDYLCYSLMYYDVSGLVNGATRQKLTQADMKKIEILLPEIEEQKKIVKILDKLNEIINKRQQQLKKLDELVKSRFIEMFGDPLLNPYNLITVKLGTVLAVEPQNGLYKPQSDYVVDKSGIPILRIDSFYNGQLRNLNSLKRLNCSDIEKKRYLLKENDIVINRVNSIEYLGKCALITGLIEDTLFESNMMRLHVDETKYNPVYVTYLLCSKFIYNQILSMAKKAVNQASINQKDVENFEIYMPNLNSQNEFADFVKQTDKSKLEIQKSLDKLEILKKSLMQQYFG